MDWVRSAVNYGSIIWACGDRVCHALEFQILSWKWKPWIHSRPNFAAKFGVANRSIIIHVALMTNRVRHRVRTECVLTVSAGRVKYIQKTVNFLFVRLEIWYSMIHRNDEYHIKSVDANLHWCVCISIFISMENRNWQEDSIIWICIHTIHMQIYL